MKPILCSQFSLKHLSGGEIGICGWLQHCKAADLVRRKGRRTANLLLSHHSTSSRLVSSKYWVLTRAFLKLLDPPDQYTLNYGGASAGSTHTIHDLEASTSFSCRSNTSSSLVFFDLLLSLPAFEVPHLQSLFLQRPALITISWLCHPLHSFCTSRNH